MIVPMDNAGCAEGIVSLLKNSKILELLKNNCSKHDYETSNIWKRLEGIVDN